MTGIGTPASLYYIIFGYYLFESESDTAAAPAYWIEEGLLFTKPDYYWYGEGCEVTEISLLKATIKITNYIQIIVATHIEVKTDVRDM